MKKIIHFIPNLRVGGAETLVKDYCLLMDKSKYTLKVLCLVKSNSDYEKMLTNAGVEIYYAGTDIIKFNSTMFNWLLSIINKLLRGIAFQKNIIKYLIKEKPDILHTHLCVNLYLLLLPLMKGTQLFHTVHTNVDKCWYGSFREKFDFYATKILVRRGMRLIALHEPMKEELSNIFGVKNITILNNGVNISRFRIKITKEEARQRINIPMDSFVIGHVGTMNEPKNHLFLIDVFLNVLKNKRNAVLLLVGQGPKKGEILDKISQYGIQTNVMILSDRTDIPELLYAMDVFVFPSIYEGFPVALIEAQVVGLRCITSNAIKDAPIISNLVKRIDLNKNATYWAQNILSFSVGDVVYNDVESCSMKNIVKQLEKVYFPN